MKRKKREMAGKGKRKGKREGGWVAPGHFSG
jgi:hypothetical protein